MNATQDILANVDVNQLASMLGQNPEDVRAAADTAVSSLLSGAQQNVAQPEGAQAFANALGQHMGSPADPATPTDLNAVDFNDGAKIVNHILPASQQRQLFSGAQGQLIQKLLPLLAPIVMAYLAKRLNTGLATGGGAGGLGSILGSVLGGGAGYGQQSTGMGGMGDILGQILGGSQAGSPTTTAPGTVPSGGGLGDILGQVLGGGSGMQMPETTTTVNNGGLQMPDAGVTQNYGTQQQASGGLGGLLKNILFG